MSWSVHTTTGERKEGALLRAIGSYLRDKRTPSGMFPLHPSKQKRDEAMKKEVPRNINPKALRLPSTSPAISWGTLEASIKNGGVPPGFENMLCASHFLSIS